MTVSRPGSEPSRSLYAWQAEALHAWREAGRRGIVEAVTGTGKTQLGIEAVQEAVGMGRGSAIIVPTKELQRQWRGQLRRHLPGSVRIGELGDGKRDTLRTHDVVVAIVNSARDGQLDPPRGSLVVADECHRYAADFNIRSLADEYEMRLGLTATLERPDRREHLLVDYFSDVCFTIGYERALADEVIAHFSVALIGVPMSDREREVYDFLSGEIVKLINVLIARHKFPKVPAHAFMRDVELAAKDQNDPAHLDAVQFLSWVGKRRKLLAESDSKRDAVAALVPALKVADRALMFTESIRTAEILVQRINQAGLRSAAVHSGLSSSERAHVFQEFRNGRIDVLVAPKVLDEGVDVPEADLAVIVSSSKTKRQMVQRMGRVVRRKGDDRLARFAVLYLTGTTEDPACGAYESFLAEVTSVADDADFFDIREVGDALAFLAILEPLQPPAPRRLEGDPPRFAVEQRLASDEVSVTAYLGL